MKAHKKHINRFRKELRQYKRLKKAGKLNGKAMSIKSRLKSFAKKIGLNFTKELNGETKKRSNPAESVHDIVVHAQRLKNFGHDISEDLQKLDKKLGTEGWKWNKRKTKIIVLKEENQNHHSDSRENPCSCETRENPVKVPFSVTLKEIYDMHKFRSWKRLNSMLGSVAPCYARKPWESTTAHLSVIYVPDYHKSIYNLDLLIDGHLEGRYCSKGSSGGFKKSLKKLVDDWGDLEVVIYDQGHAKKVLGAKRYKKQERAYAKKQNAGKTAKKKKGGKTYKDFKKGDRVKFIDLPKEIDGKKSPIVGRQGTVTNSQSRDVNVDVDGYGNTGFSPENLVKIEGEKTKKQSPIGNSWEGYITERVDSIIIPVDKIKPRDKKVSKAKIKRAKKKMRKAKAGNGSERDPILVKEISDGKYKWQAVNGNTTLDIAKKSGWKNIPAVEQMVIHHTMSPGAAQRFAQEKPTKSSKKAAETKTKEQSEPDLDAIEASQNKIDNFLDSLLQA